LLDWEGQIVSDPSIDPRTAWRAELPVLIGSRVTLREPRSHDVGSLAMLFRSGEAALFGVDEPLNEFSVLQYVERALAERVAGRGFTYAVTLTAGREFVGLVQVRQLDPAFEAGEWTALLAPDVRGTGIFLEVARLAGSVAFDTVGVHRLEARVLLHNGRANGALRKLGAVQEGLLRRAHRQDGRYFDQVLWSILREDWSGYWPRATERVH
jgi:RimJ/RimL family protein N-acetyltransferase